MTTSIAFVDKRLLHRAMLIGLAGLAYVSLNARAQAADSAPTEITISAPASKIVGYNLDLTPILQTTVSARVPFNPVVLTTNSGVALLKDSVLQAARDVCSATDPQHEMDDECVLRVVRATKPQIEAAVSQAKADEAARS